MSCLFVFVQILMNVQLVMETALKTVSTLLEVTCARATVVTR